MKQPERARTTKITSVSVSPEFADIIDKYNLSPTEVFRRGIAVTLRDLGNFNYSTPMNKERSEFVKNYLRDMDLNIKRDELFNAAVAFIKVLEGKDGD